MTNAYRTEPFKGATHFTLLAWRGIGCEPNTAKTEFLKYDFHGTAHEAAKFMADAVIQELRDGDSENGGLGSLRNCYGEIFNDFLFFGHYEYADCQFTMSAIQDSGK